MFAQRAVDLIRNWSSKKNAPRESAAAPPVEGASAREEASNPQIVGLIDHRAPTEIERSPTRRVVTVWIGDSSFQALVVS